MHWNTIFLSTTGRPERVANLLSSLLDTYNCQLSYAPTPDEKAALKTSFASTSCAKKARIPRGRITDFKRETTAGGTLVCKLLIAADSALPMLNARATALAFSQSCQRCGSGQQ